MSYQAHPAPEHGKKEGLNVQAVDRALLLLRMIGDNNGPMSITELCSLSGLNRTTVWRLLSTLEQNRFIERNPSTKEYDLGIAATNLCTEPQRRYAPLIRQSLPEMRRLVELSQESAMLGVPHLSGILIVSQVDPPQSIRLRSYVNQITPLQGTSNGKVMLAHLDAGQLEQFLAGPLTASTPETIVDPGALRREIAETARRGYGMVMGELSSEENGVSAPILYRGAPVGFLSLGGPRSRFTGERMEAVAPDLCAACHRIEAALA